MEDHKNEIISTIRSCLISTKGQITLRQLEDDYRTLLGERIPYQKLGYKSLESFIQSIPSVMTTRNSIGELMVDAKVSEKSAHISSMVKKQKSSGVKKRVRIAQPPPPRLTKSAVQSSQHHQGQGGIQKWRPKKNPYVPNNKRPPIQNSPRLAAVSHNQFVSSPGYPRPKVTSKIVVPEKSGNAGKVSPSTRDNRQQTELRRSNGTPEKVENGTANGDRGSSPLSSAMKRISKLMGEISVERDSGNSSPTTEYAASYKDEELGEFVKSGDPVQDVRRFAAYHKLGNVEVKFTETKTKHSKLAHCHCKITVDKHTYSSYPEDFFDHSSAERHASQKALDDLMQKYSKRRSLLLSSGADILQRIPPMLEKHNNAVWMWQIEADYIDKYNEQLPSDWLQIIDNSSQVSIEKLEGGYVLKYCNPDDVLQKGKRLDINLNVDHVSVPCNTVNFGDNNRLLGCITAAHSVNEIWVQCIGTPEHETYRNTNNELTAFYEKNYASMVANSVDFGSCYVINGDHGWARVRVVTTPENGHVECFLLDYGDVVRVPVAEVYTLKRKYAYDQAQVFVCRFAGLEEFYEVSQDSELWQSVVNTGQEFVVEMVIDEVDDSEVAIPVVMYDPSTGTSLNQEFLTLFSIESAVPTIGKTTITEVYVSNIESNGDVYVQVRTPGFNTLMGSLFNLHEQFSTKPLPCTPPTKESSQNRIFLVEDKITQKWLRAIIIDWSPKEDLAQIHFVDQGNTEVVSVASEKMYPVEKFDPSLSQYLPQAVKVRILIEKIPGDFVARAEELLAPDQPVLLKVQSYDNENVAWVEFFRRTKDGVLIFINKAISVEAELSKFDGSSNNNNNNNNNNNENSKKRLMNFAQFGDSGAKPVPSGGSLKKPDLPKTGAYFNVNIPFAVNPWNFFVQPLDTFKQLTALMSDMQDFYNNIQYSPLQIDDIVPGNIYASKHEDGRWYRTSVLKVIHSGSISVFYCDFGFYTSLTLAQLIPLDVKHMDFPYQALKAKISGIKPLKNKWTMEDCDFFKNLVMKKQFVSVLVNIEKDELYKSDIILDLLLIDTSSDEDVNIKDLLINKGIATTV